MDQKKIIILNLSKGRIGEDASSLLGAMIITKIQLAAMSRVDIPEEDRNDFYLYVDEFQNFATDSFANILSEARKYRLCLTIAHQYIEQLGEVVKPAVFGNVGTIICFRVGAEDAEFLEKEFIPTFIIDDLVNLPKYNIATYYKGNWFNRKNN
jgi:type IV secretory pathway TraG/TraD family ATPase VirD4